MIKENQAICKEELACVYVVIMNTSEDDLEAGEEIILTDAWAYDDPMDRVILFGKNMRGRVDEKIPVDHWGKVELLFRS